MGTSTHTTTFANGHPPPSDLANLTDPFDATFRKFNVLFVLFEGDGTFF
jgi:hypothetical protein